MPSHDLDYRIFGESMQSVEIEMDPGETVIAEAGAMNYMTGGIHFAARMGDGSDTSLLGKHMLEFAGATAKLQHLPDQVGQCSAAPCAPTAT